MPAGSDTYDSDNAAIDEYRDEYDLRDLCLREGGAGCIDSGPMGTDMTEGMSKGIRMDKNNEIFQNNIDRLLLGR